MKQEENLITAVLELIAAEELDENDLVNTANEANSRENDPNEWESETVAFTAKVIRKGLEFGLKLGNHFLQNDLNIE